MHQTDSMASDFENFLFCYLSVFLISLFLKIHTALISLNHSTGFTNSLSCHLTRRSLSSWKFIGLLSWVFFVHNCNMSYPVSLISLLVFKAHFGCDSFPLATEPLEYNSLKGNCEGKTYFPNELRFLPYHLDSVRCMLCLTSNGEPPSW